MVSLMHLKNKIFTALLILLVFTGQSMADNGVNMCDMYDMYHSHMTHNQMDMASDTLVYCDGDMSSCVMDCSLSMVTILNVQSSYQVEPLTAFKIILPQSVMVARPSLSLFRPPISA